jgi:hypothetical protein
MAKAPLKFKVAPHIVEDLGLNLYTDLPRVLVEFVANAYDADSSHANITLDKTAIDQARKLLRKQYELERAEKDVTVERVEPLSSRVLPDECRIVIEDAGHGMTRDDLDRKFLVAGRRRRSEEPDAKGRSPDGRLLMGRKGIGKLAGFGVAKRIEVVTRRNGEQHATKIVLDYDQLVEKRATDEIEIDDEELPDGGGLAPSGTRITLSRLLYDPLKSRSQTIENAIADHFAYIKQEEFVIRLNGGPIESPDIEHAYAWPDPDLAPTQFVGKSLPREGGGEIRFEYRLRFTKEGEALPAARRGIRVYSNNRIASAPSLLGADTNMHGFRMTDYLDGVVIANFIDEEETDYIATDRESLRWESPLLSGLHEFLSEEIKTACAQYQKLRDEVAPNIVKADPFTQAEIAKCELSRRDRTMAIRLGVVLKNACKRGVEDPSYRAKLPVFLRSIGHGNILAAISELAEQPTPDIAKVAIEIARLTADEFDQFISYAKARLKGIAALKKVVKAADFKDRENEPVIQELFEKSPWLIDPTYTQFLSADESFDVLMPRLAKELRIGKHAPPDAGQKDERPDLVFLLGNRSLDRLVIVELKSANLPLESKHLDQLHDYMITARDWLRGQSRTGVAIRGQLLGSLASPRSRARGARALRKRMEDEMPNSDWRVRDYMQVLSDTEAVHTEILQAHRKTEEAMEEEGEDTTD